MTLAIIQLLLVQLILPAAFLLSLWKKTFHSKLDWMIQSLFTLVFIVWIFLAMPWDWSSYYVRFLWPLLFLTALYISWKKVRPLPFLIKFSRSQKLSLGFEIVLFLIFGLYVFISVNGLATKTEALQLDFPLKEGTYFVRQGGDSLQLNYHYAYANQQYAVDVTELNAFGMRASGIYPKELEKYYIFGAQLYAPCSGVIVSARNDLPDLTPPESDAENAAGNHVIIQCDNEDAEVLLAHMLEGSVLVEVGDTVASGQEIGKIGNSGNTTEPHLHIHAEIDGKGVPIEFNSRFLVRNSLVW